MKLFDRDEEEGTASTTTETMAKDHDKRYATTINTPNQQCKVSKSKGRCAGEDPLVKNGRD